jgi:hypothetical protein
MIFAFGLCPKQQEQSLLVTMRMQIEAVRYGEVDAPLHQRRGS